MSRVLIGELGTIAGLGLREVLDEQGFDLVADEGGYLTHTGDTSATVIRRLVSAAPDCVVLDLDAERGVETAELICRLFPAVKVIACSAREPLMRVYPPFHHGDYYVTGLSPSLLAEAVRS